MNETRQKGSFTFDDANSKRVSYVMPTKNRAGFLAGALKGVRGLKGLEDELILIDGGSTDDTLAIVEQNRDLIDIFVSEPDKEAFEAGNKGIMLARGKFVYIAADDDIIYREGMGKAIDVLESNPQIDMIICGGIRKFGNHLKKPFYIPPGTNYGSKPGDTFFYKACGMGAVYRRKTFVKFGLFDSIAADLDMPTRIIYRGGQVRFCRVNLFLHTLYKHSVVVSKKRAYRKECFRIARAYCSRTFYVNYLISQLIIIPVRRFYRRALEFIIIRILKKSLKLICLIIFASLNFLGSLV